MRGERWGCLEWAALYLGLGFLVVCFMVSEGVVRIVLMMTLGYEVGNMPPELKRWSIALSIVFWVVLFFLLGYRDVRKEKRRKQALQLASPVDLSPDDFEEFTRLCMLNSGYTDVRVVGKTGDFGADIVGKDPFGRRIAVQCKRYRGSTGVKAVQEVFSAQSYYDCEVSAVFTTGHFTKQAVELATKNGVELYRWNGHKFVPER